MTMLWILLGAAVALFIIGGLLGIIAVMVDDFPGPRKY
jgi:hypothetical protein